MIKEMTHMNDTELFCVLTGSYGPFMQMDLKKAIRAYKKSHNNQMDTLSAMVQAYNQAN